MIIFFGTYENPLKSHQKRILKNCDRSQESSHSSHLMDNEGVSVDNVWGDLPLNSMMMSYQI